MTQFVDSGKVGRRLFTVGHSTHEFPTFARLLTENGVSALIDVRSQPHSRLEHFRRADLSAALKAIGIAYVFLGRELGARREEPQCYVNGQATYENVSELPAFREGLDRIERLADSQIVALMCAEREPLDCHRSVLIARHLVKRGMNIKHILADGKLENHAHTEQRMVRLMGVDPLFDSATTEPELVERAYAERGREIAYRTINEEGSSE